MRWHRRLGIVACIPMLMWCFSGVLHPLMSRLKPHVATSHAPALALKTGELLIAPQMALNRLDMKQTHDMRLVRFGGHLWWQVFATADAIPVYVNAASGKVNANGDQAYAMYLARLFAGDVKMQVKDIKRVTHFSTEYPAIHRLLPVWRVALDRPDGLTAFVDTSSSRLGALADDHRFLFLRFFDLFHAWGWLDGMGAFKIFILATVCALCLIAGLFGLLIYSGMMGKWGKSSSGVVPLAWYHRQLGVLFSVGLLMFAVSGVWQALSHWWPDNREQFYDRTLLPASMLSTSLPTLLNQARASGDIKDLSLSMVDSPCWRVALDNGHDMYWHTDTGSRLEKGEQIYARKLAGLFSGMDNVHIAAIRHITRFNGEYGFIDKRLPVWRIDYDMPSHPRIYVETGTGHLALRMNDGSAAERWTFTNLHKWGLINAFGKGVRDGVMALFAFVNGIAAFLGGFIYCRRRKRKRHDTTHKRIWSLSGRRGI